MIINLNINIEIKKMSDRSMQGLMPTNNKNPKILFEYTVKIENMNKIKMLEDFKLMILKLLIQL